MRTSPSRLLLVSLGSSYGQNTRSIGAWHLGRSLVSQVCDFQYILFLKRLRFIAIITPGGREEK